MGFNSGFKGLIIPSLIARRQSIAASIHKLPDSAVVSMSTARLRIGVSGETIRVWISLSLVVGVLRVKGKTFPLQAWTVPKDTRRLRLPDFKIIGT